MLEHYGLVLALVCAVIAILYGLVTVFPTLFGA